jgi:hypothetical protein
MKHLLLAAIVALFVSPAYGQDSNKSVAGHFERISDWHYLAADPSVPQCGGKVMSDELDAISEMSEFTVTAAVLTTNWNDQFYWVKEAQAYVELNPVPESKTGEVWVYGFVLNQEMIAFEMQHYDNKKLTCVDAWMARLKKDK